MIAEARAADLDAVLGEQTGRADTRDRVAADIPRKSRTVKGDPALLVSEDRVAADVDRAGYCIVVVDEDANPLLIAADRGLADILDGYAVDAAAGIKVADAFRNGSCRRLRPNRPGRSLLTVRSAMLTWAPLA